jgi:hypothetical protein
MFRLPDRSVLFMASLMLPALVLSLSVVAAEAFEYRGFRSGMTLAEAIETARLQGIQLTPLNAPNMEIYALGVPPDAAGALQFCDSRLFNVSGKLGGDIDAFASKAQELASRYGNQPVVVARSGFTENGLVSMVTIQWTVPPDEEASVMLFKNGAATSVDWMMSAQAQVCEAPG